MWNLENNQSLTHRRNVYINTVFNSMLSQGAKDLESGLDTREVIVTAIAKVIAAVMPNTGQGHAESIKSQVSDKIDAILASMDSDDAQEDDVEAA